MRREVAFKTMPNGNIRAYQIGTYDKRGVSELQIISPRNFTHTVISGNVLLTYLIYEK